MCIECGYQTAVSDFGFSKRNKNGKIVIKNMSQIFQKKQRNICERTLRDIFVYKISGRYVEKQLSFAVLSVKNVTFHAIHGSFIIFPIFSCDRFGTFKKCSRDIFVLLTKI